MSTIALGAHRAPVNGAARPRRQQVPTTAGVSRRPVQQRGSLRLTSRGRVVVLLLFLGALLSAFVLVGARTAATEQPGAPVRTTTVVVRPGDTLWQIAAQHTGSADLRDAVRAIEELNGMSDATIVVGQKLFIPVGQ